MSCLNIFVQKIIKNGPVMEDRKVKRIRKLRNKKGKVFAIETNLTGRQLLNNRVLNKDVAFSQEERIAFNLLGYLQKKLKA